MARVVWAPILAIICVKLVEGQRRQFLQDVIQRIRGYPRHRSSSPSWGGERQFEIIGTGRLPIQNQRYGSQLEDGRKGLENTPRPVELGTKNKQFYDRYDLDKIDRYETSFIDFKKENQDFPAFSSFYLGQNLKQRNKRSAANSPFYHSMRPRRRPRQRLDNQDIDRFDDGGFWDDEDFDGDIFGLRSVGSHPTQQKRNMYKQQQGRGDKRQQGVQEDKQQQGKGDRRQQGVQEDKQRQGRGDRRQQGVQEDKQQQGRREKWKQEDTLKHQAYASEYPTNRNYEDNEVLGSGNFAVVKGGTYYRKGAYRYRTNSNNHHPQAYNYYGSNNFNNFRDFADIKGDRLAERSRF